MQIRHLDEAAADVQREVEFWREQEPRLEDEFTKELDAAIHAISLSPKVCIASELKPKTSAPSTWIAQRLNMGAPQLVGVYVNRLQIELERQSKPDFDLLIPVLRSLRKTIKIELA